MTELSAMERRITLRLLGYWEKKRKDRSMPSQGDINPDDIRDLWDSCFLLRVAPSVGEDYDYVYMGDAVTELCNADICPDSKDIPIMSGRKLAAACAKVIETGKPLLEDGEFKNERQQTVKYRRCLLPLGENGQVAAIFGGLRFRIFNI